MSNATFFQVDFEVAKTLIDAKLTANTYRVWFYIMTLDPFGDRPCELPSYEQIGEKLGFSEATARRTIDQLSELGAIIVKKKRELMNQVKNLKTGLVKSGKNIRRRLASFSKDAKNFCPDRDCKKDSQNEKQAFKLEKELQNCKIQQPELPPLEASESLQTKQTLQTNQTEAGEKNILKDKIQPTKAIFIPRDGEKIEDNYLPIPKQDKPAKNNQQPISQDKQESSASVVQNKEKIPQDLQQKLESLGIRISPQIEQAIKAHHISQAYGAAAHVENTWDTVKNPVSIFMYQLPKQRIERLGSAHSQERLQKIIAENKAIDAQKKDPALKAERENCFQQIREILKKNLSKNSKD